MDISTKESLLKNLNLGSSIAEHDKNLSKYFIDTNYVSDFINGRYDIIQGVKGAGKTAMFLTIYKNQNNYPELEGIQLIRAMDLKGDPHFKEAFNIIDESLDEDKLNDAWKIYIVNLLWREMKELGFRNSELEKYLIKTNLVTDEPGFLGKFVHALKEAKFKLTNTFSPDGSVTQGFEIGGSDHTAFSKKRSNIIDFNYIFSSIDSTLEENDQHIWLMLDRLDDAFPKNTDNDKLALKCLLLAYKDIYNYDNFKLKIFIRNDIFNNITKNGFTSLTHVSAKTMTPIEWDKEKMELLLYERLLFNAEFKAYLMQEVPPINFSDYRQTKKRIFKFLFKEQVDVGKNNPDTTGWILNHITDGLNIATPRDFIALIDAARTIELESLAIPSNRASNVPYLLSASSLRKAYAYISKQKLTTQLYAEYPHVQRWTKLFHGRKAEHNEETLKEILGKQWRHRVEKLNEIGFLEKKVSSQTWKIPFIYRVELDIKRGSEFNN